MTTKESFNRVLWHSLNNNNELENESFSVAQKNNISISLAKLLINRKIKKIPNFLNSKLKENISISQIMKLNNIEKSIQFFEKVKLDKKIAIFSDYDVDGACSAAICKKLFLQFNIETMVYIPNRFNEGYGLNISAINKMLDFSSNILVLDCGSNNIDEQRYVHEKKAQIMVVDHHECDDFFDQAIVINPKTPNDKSSLNDLCATGLIFLIFVYLKYENIFSASDILKYLDLVALATICDLVPLNSINRSMVKQGLRIINSENLNKGIQTLINQAKIKQTISEYHLGFILGPRINAGGRMGESLLGFQLLSSENIHQALQYAQIIEGHNQNRQKIQSQIVDDIDLEESNNQNINFFYNEKWHIGIVGIIAGRLMRINNKPSFVMTTSNDVVVGSGRSLGEKNIGQLMMAASEKGILIKGGGHAKACGFTLLEGKVDEFKLFLNEETKDIKINNSKYYESSIDLNVVNEKLLKDLDLLSPFGQQHSEPIFKCSDLKIQILKVFKEKHAKLILSDDLGLSCAAMLFDTNILELRNYMSNKSHFDCYFKVKKDSYSNDTVIHLEDIH